MEILTHYATADPRILLGLYVKKFFGDREYVKKNLGASKVFLLISGTGCMLNSRPLYLDLSRVANRYSIIRLSESSDPKKPGSETYFKFQFINGFGSKT